MAGDSSTLTITAALRDEITRPVQKIEAEVKNLGNVAAKAGKQGADAAKSTTDAIGKQSQSTRDATDATKRQATAMERAAAAAKKASGYYTEHKKSLDTLSSSALRAGTVMAAGLAYAVKQYSDFSGRMAQVKSLSHASASQMSALTNAAMTMGAQYGQSANDVADAEIELTKAGIGVKDQLGGALPGALALAAAGQIDVGQAAEIATISMTQFGLAGRDVPHVADLLAAGADKALGSVQDLGYGLKQGGLVASGFGLNIDQTIGTLSAFANAGLLGSDAGTSMKTMFQSLENPTTKAKSVLDKYGITLTDQQGKYVSVTNLAGQLHDKLGNLTQAQRTSALATVFGSDAVRAATVLYQNGAKGIQGWIDGVNDQGFAAEQAAGKMNSLQGDFIKLKAAFQTSMISTGGSQDSFLRPVVQGATNLIHTLDSIPAPMKSVLAGLTGFTAVGLLAFGGLVKAVSGAMSLKKAFDGLNLSGGTTARTITKTGLAAAGTVAGIMALSAAYEQLYGKQHYAVQGASEIQAALQNTGSAGGAQSLDKIFNGMSNGGDQFNNLTDAMKAFKGQGWVQGFDMWATGVLGINDDTRQFNETVTATGEALGQMVSAGYMDTATSQFSTMAKAMGGNTEQQEKLLDAMPGYKDALAQQATESGLAADKGTLLKIALGQIKVSSDDATGSVSGTGKAAKKTAGLVQQASAAQVKAAQEQRDAWSKAYQQQVDPMATWSAMVKNTTAKGITDWEKFKNGATVNLRAYSRELQSQITAQRNWSKNLSTLVDSGISSTALDYLVQQGPAAAGLVQELVDAPKKQRAHILHQFSLLGAGAGDAFASGLQQRQSLLQAIGDRWGAGVRNRVGKQLETGKTTVEKAAQRWGATLDANSGTYSIDVNLPNKQVAHANKTLDDICRPRMITLKFNSSGVPTGIGTTADGTSGNGLGVLTSQGNKSKKRAAATGGTWGTLPGYTPGTDVHHFYSPTAGMLSLSGGEHIDRPEVTRVLGPELDMLNAAARSGGIGGVRQAISSSMLGAPSAATSTGMANGGVWTIRQDPRSYKHTVQGAVSAIRQAAAASSGGSGSGGMGGIPGGSVPKGSLQKAAQALLNQMGWGGQWNAFNSLVMRESGWNVHATNPSSGAYGIPQSLPASKLASAGSDWRDNGVTQLRWMMGYIKGRYGSPNAAWGHETSAGWYRNGGTLRPRLYDTGGVLPHRGVAVNLSGKPETVRTAGQEQALSSPQVVSIKVTVNARDDQSAHEIAAEAVRLMKHELKQKARAR